MRELRHATTNRDGAPERPGQPAQPNLVRLVDTSDMPETGSIQAALPTRWRAEAGSMAPLGEPDRSRAKTATTDRGHASARARVARRMSNNRSSWVRGGCQVAQVAHNGTELAQTGPSTK